MTGEAGNEKTRIASAQLDWDADAPRSILFGDIYFSGDGEAETDHVFLKGNDLPARFAGARRFVIGELGFGTGLNFLKTWARWLSARRPEGARLHFFSVEAFPLHADDMVRAHAAWPNLAALAARLRAKLPPPAPGLHQLHLDDDVTLTLAFGEAEATLKLCEGGVDAWFFDGFSPAKNPEMWRAELFEEAARLSIPGATFATFTVAGAVRRALEAAGFEHEKRPGFGGKREMLAGRLIKTETKSRRAPWFQNASARHLSPGAEIGIIGGGIAGASLAYAARRSGLRPTIIEPTGLAAGASGNPSGLVMPRLDLGGGPAARFFVSAYFHTLRTLCELMGEDAPSPSVHPREGGDLEQRPHWVPAFAGTVGETWFTPCGVLLGASDENERQRQDRILGTRLLPDGWIEGADDGLFFPQAGVVHAPSFVAALAGGIELIKARAVEIRHDEEAPTIRLDNGETRRFDAVVIANGVEALNFREVRTLPLSAVAGQVDWFPDATAPEHALACGPYAAPAPEGGLVIGATYEKLAPGAAAQTRRAATHSNIESIAAFAPDLAGGLDAATSRPRASVRCQTPDRLPVAGPLPDLAFYGGAYDDLRLGVKRDYPSGQMHAGTYILAGLGSRGLVTAPLLAAVIVAEMTGEPAPVDHEIAEIVHPARFFIRDLKRAKIVRKG